MARRTIHAGSYDYTVAFDDRRPGAAYLWGVVRAHLTDEITDQSPVGPLWVTTDTPGLTARAATNGVVGVAGVPTAALSMLDTTPYPIRFTIQADGYIPHDVAITLLPQAGFPGSFVPAPVQQLALHRAPTIIRGRVLLQPGLTPVAGASVAVSGFWRVAVPGITPPPPPPQPPHIAAMSPPLYAPRVNGVDGMRRRNMTVVAGDDKALVAAADAASRTVRISNAKNVALGTILQIDALNPDRSEYLEVVGLIPGATVDDPASATLRYPLFWPHREGVVVSRVLPQPPGATNLFTADGIRGDTCALLNQTLNLAGAGAVEVFGSAAPEYHRIGLFDTVTDAGGFYQLPPISRVARLLLRVDDGVHLPVTTPYMPRYRSEEERVDVVLQ